MDQRPADWLTGRSKPPTWFRLIGCLAVIAPAAGIVVKRGVVVGTVAVVVYGLIGRFQLLAWERMTDWSKHHPWLDRLIIVPLLFLAVAYFTKLSIAICVLIALLAGLLVVALCLVRRARRRTAG